MRKLKLDVHALRVESFEAAGSGAGTGTVRGNSEEPVVSGYESCGETVCATCLCPYSGPEPSCMPCADLQYCDTFPPICP